MDRRHVSKAGRPTALEIKGQTQNSFFQIGIQGFVKSPSTQNECKCDHEGPDDNPGTNSVPHQPGVTSEPSGCAGLLCLCSMELEQLHPCQSTLIPWRMCASGFVCRQLNSSSLAAPGIFQEDELLYLQEHEKSRVNKGL